MFLLCAVVIGGLFCTSEASLSANPVADWPLSSDTKGNDVSGNGNHAIAVNDVTYETGPGGIPGTAMRFKGTHSSYVQFTRTHSLHIGTGSFSIATFVKISGNGYGAFLDWVGPDWIWGVEIWSYPAFHLGISFRSPAHFKRNPSPKFTKDTWQYLGLTWYQATSNRTGRLTYVVDDLIGHVEVMDDGTHPPKTDTEYVYISKRSHTLTGTDRLNGSMSCLKIYRTTLSRVDLLRNKLYCIRRERGKHFEFFSYVKPGAIAQANVNGTYTTRSLSECLVNCLRNDQCISVSYAESTGKCLLSDMEFSSGIVKPDTDVNSRVYTVDF